jgi:hypothetical protein
MQSQLYAGNKVIDQNTVQDIYKKEIQRAATGKSSGPVGSSIAIAGPQVMSQT